MADMTTWSIDPAHTSVEFAVKHMMFTTVRGRFKSVGGTIEVDEEQPDRSSVEVEIDAASIDTGVEDRDEHLRSADFLDVEHQPKITFRSKRVEGAMQRPGERFRVVGDLTIRGQTLETTLDATYQGRGKGPQGEERAGFAATTEIDRRDFGLMWNRALEAGGILVGYDVRIELDVQAVRMEEKRRAPRTAGHGPRGDRFRSRGTVTEGRSSPSPPVVGRRLHVALPHQIGDAGRP